MDCGKLGCRKSSWAEAFGLAERWNRAAGIELQKPDWAEDLLAVWVGVRWVEGFWVTDPG